MANAIREAQLDQLTQTKKETVMKNETLKATIERLNAEIDNARESQDWVLFDILCTKRQSFETALRNN